MLNKLLMSVFFTLCACNMNTDNGETGESEEIMWASEDIEKGDELYLFA
jgi:hypothetical protein